MIQEFIEKDADARAVFDDLVRIIDGSDEFELQLFEQQYASLIEMVADEMTDKPVRVTVGFTGEFEAIVDGRSAKLLPFRQSRNARYLVSFGNGLYELEGDVSTEQFVLERVNAQVAKLLKSHNV